MAKAYDEFDNLIFETEDGILTQEQRDEFTKTVMQQFYKCETNRMELFKTECLATEAGKKAFGTD